MLVSRSACGLLSSIYPPWKGAKFQGGFFFRHATQGGRIIKKSPASRKRDRGFT